MYGYEWTKEHGIFCLTINSKVGKEIRPVFKEELDFFGFNEYWQYPDTDKPLLWAEGIRRYVLNGECVAEARGGGFYTKPVVEVYKNGLVLSPIDIDTLWTRNSEIMHGLEQKAIISIRNTYEKFKKQGYSFVVAFSGGKDSLVLLDIVAKALSPDEFYVIFSNTGMELDATLNSVRMSKEHWSNLHFIEAESHLSPERTWDEFGPPGRRMRWCCSVHKSVPTIIKLREITGDYNVKAVIIDGIRAEESAQRAGYQEISEGAKNINQVNYSPLLKWGSAEIYVHLLHNSILFNTAYRIGLFRVGCKVCPLSSPWWDGIANNKYHSEVTTLLDKIENYASLTKPQKEQQKFIEKGGWKARMGGRGLPNGGNRVTEIIDNNTIKFCFAEKKQDWFNTATLLGPIVEGNNKNGIQLIDHQDFSFNVDDTDGFSVSYTPYSLMNRFVVSHLRGVANKVAYCIGCKACVVQCPNSAFEIDYDGKIMIHEENCSHCYNCIVFTHGKGCLVAKSLSTTGGYGMDLKGMNRYQHFGLRKHWLEHFFAYKSDCFTQGQLGNLQYDSLKVWLREAGLLSSTNRGNKIGQPTPLFEKLEPLGPFNPLTWAIIWANLAYNSIIVKWYMLYAPPGEVYEKNDLVYLLGDDYSQSTRDNAVTALLETLRHSPIGSVLKQGIPITSGNSYKYAKQGWESPEAVPIIYALYLWAESTGRYSFSLSQLEEARGKANTIGVDPVSIYGLNPASFKDILQEIAIHYDKYIRVGFVADLDSVKLYSEFSSLDIIDLVINQ
jgi:phosphoadenosine phosphosulfate reductase